MYNLHSFGVIIYRSFLYSIWFTYSKMRQNTSPSLTMSSNLITLCFPASAIKILIYLFIFLNFTGYILKYLASTFSQRISKSFPSLKRETLKNICHDRFCVRIHNCCLIWISVELLRGNIDVVLIVIVA